MMQVPPHYKPQKRFRIKPHGMGFEVHQENILVKYGLFRKSERKVWRFVEFLETEEQAKKWIDAALTPPEIYPPEGASDAV